MWGFLSAVLVRYSLMQRLQWWLKKWRVNNWSMSKFWKIIIKLVHYIHFMVLYFEWEGGVHSLQLLPQRTKHLPPAFVHSHPTEVIYPQRAPQFTTDSQGCSAVFAGVTVSEWGHFCASYLGFYLAFDWRLVLYLYLLVHLQQPHLRSSFGHCVAHFKWASFKRDQNEFWWNPRRYWRLWEIPEDVVCMDLSTSDLSCIPHADFCLHRGCSSSYMPPNLALNRYGSHFELQPSDPTWWPVWVVMHCPLEPQRCCNSWWWASSWELPGTLGVQQQHFQKHHSNWGKLLYDSGFKFSCIYISTWWVWNVDLESLGA